MGKVLINRLSTDWEKSGNRARDIKIKQLRIKLYLKMFRLSIPINIPEWRIHPCDQIEKYYVYNFHAHRHGRVINNYPFV